MKVRIGVAGGLIAAGVLVSAPPVNAADWDDLVALTTCDASSGPLTVTLDAPIDQPDGVLVIGPGCGATIDLNGHALTVDRVDVQAAASLTVVDASDPDTGQLNAAASATGEAGVGVPEAASLVLAGGAVTAVGAPGGSGIGGDASGVTGSIVIAGGVVDASGGSAAAGIGSALEGAGGFIEIQGGSVTAVGGEDFGLGLGGAGIGGGSHATGGAGRDHRRHG